MHNWNWKSLLFSFCELLLHNVSFKMFKVLSKAILWLLGPMLCYFLSLQGQHWFSFTSFIVSRGISVWQYTFVKWRETGCRLGDKFICWWIRLDCGLFFLQSGYWFKWCWSWSVFLVLCIYICVHVSFFLKLSHR